MKKMFLCLLFGVLFNCAEAQLGVPSISSRDTLLISRVLYNNYELNKNDWPADILIEDALELRIGKHVYKKEHFDQDYRGIRFEVMCNGTKTSLVITKEDGCTKYSIDKYTFYVSPLVNARMEYPETQSLFDDKKANNDGSQDVTTESDDQGKCGAGYSLSGRKASSIPLPGFNIRKEGKVVVKIYVDQNGKVTNATAPEKGSTIFDGAMVQRAIASAKQARFNADINASEIQVGTITYVFRVK